MITTEDIAKADLANKILAPYLNILENMDNVYILGTGITGQHLYNVFTDTGIKINGFLDNYKDSQEFNNIKVYKPENIPDRKEDATVIIASINYSFDLYQQLKSSGFTKIVPFQILALFDEKYEVGFSYEDLLKDYINNHVEYKSLYNYFEDERSIFVLDKLIEYRETFSTEIYNEIFSRPQYFESFMPKERVFIDGGSYDGSTSLNYIDFVNNEYDKIYVFEPDNLVWDKVQSNLKNTRNIEFFKYGLSDSNKTLKFDAKGNAGSLFSENGTEEVTCVALDDIVKEDRALIKLDIEGAEIDALNGAKRLIQNKSPLAVCVYHKPADLWQIPKLIKSLNPEYRLYLRHHSSCMFETVLYAV